MDISNSIIKIRTEKHLKQSDIADRLGIERSNYARLEKRGSKLTIEQLEQIAKAMDVTLLDILYPEHTMKKDPELSVLEKQNKDLENKNKIAIRYLNECHSFCKHLYLVFLDDKLQSLSPDKITIADVNKLWASRISFFYNDKERKNRLKIESPMGLGLSMLDFRDTLRMLRENIWSILQTMLPSDDPRVDQNFYDK